MANIGWSNEEDTLARVRRAVAEGARLVDLGPAGAAAIAAVRAAQPDVIVCADAPGADLTRDQSIAERTGAALLASPGESGPGAGLVAAAPTDVAPLTRAGWQVLVDVDGENAAATVAVAAICAWLGARIIRTRQIGSVRQAVDMVESIRGNRAPTWTRRGLA